MCHLVIALLEIKDHDKNLCCSYSTHSLQVGESSNSALDLDPFIFLDESSQESLPVSMEYWN